MAGCDTRVVNLSSMTPSEVDELAAGSDDGFCVRIVAKPNGMPILRSPPRRSFLRRLVSMVAIAVPVLAGACRDDPEEEINPDDVGSAPCSWASSSNVAFTTRKVRHVPARDYRSCNAGSPKRW